jgi:lipoic acid synthetase
MWSSVALFLFRRIVRITYPTIPIADGAHARVANVSRMPGWIRQELGKGEHYAHTADAVHGHDLHTVCEAARCPNRGECWSRGTATFMLLGDICTRACGFCSVKTGRPKDVDLDEPRRVSQAVASMGLRYVVLTSVNRDDQADGGAGIFADTLRRLRAQDPHIGVEFLTPDFRNCQHAAVASVTAVLDEMPGAAVTGGVRLVWGHNMETVPGLYRRVRKGAVYARSLALLEHVARLPGVEAKSALMLGLGETRDEVLAVMRDLRAAGVQRLSLGQYLRPTREHLPVLEYVHPQVFADLENAGRALGFAWIKAGPLVRSSYHAEEIQTATASAVPSAPADRQHQRG